MSETTPPPVPDFNPAFGSSPNLPVALDEGAERARSKGWRYVNLDAESSEVSPEVLARMEGRIARQYNVVPIEVKHGREIVVACEDPDDFDLRQILSPLFDGLTMRLVYADGGAIRRRIEIVYSARDEASRLAGQRSTKRRDAHEGGDLGRIEGAAEGDNVKLLRLVLEQALRDKASDVHIEPTEDALEIRYRIDGKLRIVGTFPRARAEGLVTLIKVEASMKTDNSLMPDSGVMIFKQSGAKDVDMRVETAPTAWGQSCVMRLQSDIWRPLDTLGFSETNEKRFRDAIGQPFGVILATGPTGSGKSTTLYSALREKIAPTEKIITLENPIEYKAPRGISQMAINDAQNMTFAGGLRSILRQDPDIILVGEIRDTETAETAVDAAMTGHLVFSTLHTNDAPGAIPRLMRMEIEPLLVADSLVCVLGQRLVRRLCPTCRITVAADIDKAIEWGFDADRLPEQMFDPHPDGCNDCRNTGWAGRVPIHEVMLVSDEMVDAISSEAQQSVLHKLAREAGMSTMREDGFDKALAGLTTIAEINSSTRRSLA